jgi:hypothetical protein
MAHWLHLVNVPYSPYANGARRKGNIMRDVRPYNVTVPASWASAGIVDARAFKVGESTTIHVLTHAEPNLVRGACGITAHVVERDNRLAYWASGYVEDDTECPSCKEAR